MRRFLEIQTADGSTYVDPLSIVAIEGISANRNVCNVLMDCGVGIWCEQSPASLLARVEEKIDELVVEEMTAATAPLTVAGGGTTH